MTERLSDELAEAIKDDGFEPEAVQAWANHTGEEVTEWDRPTREAFQDAYNGEHEDETAFAGDLAEDMGWLANSNPAADYFDYEAFARDLFMSDYYSADSGHHTVYVFRTV